MRRSALALLLACGLAAPPARSFADDSAKRPVSAKSPVRASSQQKKPSSISDAERDARLEREIRELRKETEALRREIHELHELRDKDPQAFEQRVREEEAAFDARKKKSAKAPTAGVSDEIQKIGVAIDGGEPVTAQGAAPVAADAPAIPTTPPQTTRTDTTTAATAPAPASEPGAGLPLPPNMQPTYASTDPLGRPIEALVPNVTQPIPVVPTDANGRPIGAPVSGVGAAEPLPVVGLGTLSGQTVAGIPIEAAAAAHVPWWEVFLMKVLEICGRGLEALFGNKFGDLNDRRSAIVRREAGNDPARRAAVDGRLRRAIEGGFNTSSAVPVTGPSPSTPTVPLSAPANAPTWSLQPTDGTPLRLPRANDPDSGEERIVVDLPLGGVEGSP